MVSLAGPPYAHGRTVEIWRAVDTTDEYGNTVPGEFLLTHVVMGCGVAPRRESELLERGRMGVIVGWTVYMWYQADVRVHDRVRIDGEFFEIDGEPGVWQQPMSGWDAGIEINLKRVEG